jgi:hypothetical protein
VATAPAGKTWSPLLATTLVPGLAVGLRDAGRVVSMACLVAIGVAASGERRALGLELAASNDEGNAWSGFVRGLLERGLKAGRRDDALRHHELGPDRPTMRSVGRG